MAKLENNLKKYLIRIMGTRWDVQSHEDRFSLGIPDLSYADRGVNGWIELKHVKEWPKRASTTVKWKRYTPEQVNWLNKRGKKGGSCWILVQVGTEHFVFPFYEGRKLRAGMTEDEFHERCVQYWEEGIEPLELLDILCDGHILL